VGAATPARPSAQADFASNSPCPSRTNASNVFGFAPPIGSQGLLHKGHNEWMFKTSSFNSVEPIAVEAGVEDLAELDVEAWVAGDRRGFRTAGIPHP